MHFINGVWGLLSVVIFDTSKGFVSGNPEMETYLGIQIAGALSITAWGVVCSLIFFLPLEMCGWNKYHPVIEMLGVSKLKMGEMNSKFLIEMRSMFEGGIKDSNDYLVTENQGLVKQS